MSRLFCLLLLFVVTGCAAGTAQVNQENPQVNQENPQVDMTDSLNKLSYAAGYKVGDMFQNQRLKISPDAVLKGMYDARKNAHPALTKAQIKEILRDPKAFLISEHDVQTAKAFEEGTSFLQTNGQRKEVVVLPSGLQYQILSKGQGASPQLTDRVKMKYTGKQLNGNVFDSTASTGQPAEFSMQSLVPGLIEGLQLMKEGDKWEFYLPNHLAFGNRSPLANKAVIFEIELVEVLPAG